MAKAHARDATSQNQPETSTHADVPPIEPPGNAPTSAFPSGSFPLSGRLTDRLWGQILDVNPRTIRDWVKEHNIPHKRVGDVVVIEANDFWLALPSVKPSEATKSNRGGARQKKGT